MGKFLVFSQIFNQLRIRPDVNRKAERVTELAGFRTHRANQVDKIKNKGLYGRHWSSSEPLFFSNSPGSFISGLREINRRHCCFTVNHLLPHCLSLIIVGISYPRNRIKAIVRSQSRLQVYIAGSISIQLLLESPVRCWPCSAMGAMTDIRAGLCAAYAIHQVFGSRGSWAVPVFAA